MANAPIVSIVLPVWNGERFLAQAVESILGQTFCEFELIVVNDCSTDTTPEIIEHYAALDPRIRVVHNEKNLRLPASLNEGFRIATGQYYTWTSDDNILHPIFLETLLGELTKNSADLIYSDFNSVDEYGEFVAISQVGEPQRLVAQNVVGASFLYRKEVHERLGGYNVERFLYEDYDFWVRAFLAGFKFFRSPSVVYDYRRHGSSLTSTRKPPDEYALYRYELRQRFGKTSKDIAFEARVILLGYRSVLGPSKWLKLLAESALLNPAGTLQYLAGMASRVPAKIRRHLTTKPAA